MATYRSVRFHVPEAQLLADLEGVDLDLQNTGRLCERLISEFSKEPPDFELLEALCAAALVRYGRTLNSGVRSGLPKELMNNLSPDQKEAHHFFKESRDKWIAHSVNSFEENEVSIWLMPEEHGPMSVTSVSVRKHRVTSLSSDAIDKLRELCVAIRERLKPFIDAEKDKVLKIAQSQPAELFYQQIDSSILPGRHHPKKGEKQAMTANPSFHRTASGGR